MTIMNRVKIILTDSHRGAVEAFVGVVAMGALLGLVLYGVIFIGQVL
jgi:hypothetical protein